MASQDRPRRSHETDSARGENPLPRSLLGGHESSSTVVNIPLTNISPLENGDAPSQNDDHPSQGSAAEQVLPGNTSLWQKLKTTVRPWTPDDGRYDDFRSIARRPNAVHKSFIDLIRDAVGDYPDGYPRFAAFMTADINTRLYRRYGWERNRLLLHKQDTIAMLSDELKALDDQHSQEYPDRLYSRRRDEAEQPCRRSEILARLAVQLKEYDDLLLREHAITSLPQSTARNHRTVFDWVFNTKPVYTNEFQYLNQVDDFALLGNQHDMWARGLEEKIFSLSQVPIIDRIFRSKKDKRTDDDTSTFASNYMADLIVKVTVTLATTALLILPVILLYVLKMSAGIKLVVIAVFVLAFCMALSIMTSAKRHEVFAATAAYCAVLVVFLANLPNDYPGQV